MPEENKTVPGTAVKTAKSETKPEGKPKNCRFCNRVLKRRGWYFRDGKYYCKKKCWSEERKKPLKT